VANKENIIGKGFDVHPENINRKGYEKGLPNRSTVAKFILSLEYIPPKEAMDLLKKQYKNLPKNFTIEEMATLMQAKKSIDDQDTAAYKALMDSAHGAPKQEHEHTRKEPLTINVIRDRNQNK